MEDEMPKKEKPTPEYDSERETRVLLEKIGSDVKTVAEQHTDVIKKIDELKNDVSELKDDMAIVRPAVTKNSNDLRDVKSELNSVKSELNSVKMAVKDVDVRVGRVEQKLDTTLTNHEQRIKKVEEKVGA